MSVNLAGVRVPARGAAALPARVRSRRLAVEVVKFGLVGGSGVAVNFLAFNALLHGGAAPPMAATVIASCLAMATNYLGFRFFTYRDRAARVPRQLALFLAFSGLGILMESGLFYVSHHGLGLTGPVGSNAAKALSIALASAFRFLAYRAWVFAGATSP
ncbi:GtrA family protein [Streptomyces sp. CRN 30]|uniref:GtrA family protein n=1 Tax=Streptomyces sp. CRN 30 TaxID=3075613 RepID=UPI002A802CB0|nr:GtrA family protein [Streptomyces sp. CRN 30]